MIVDPFLEKKKCFCLFFWRKKSAQLSKLCINLLPRLKLKSGEFVEMTNCVQLLTEDPQSTAVQLLADD